MKRLVMVSVMAACGDGSSSPDVDAPPGVFDGPGIDVIPIALALTSPAFSEGTAIPALHTCDGANTSPELAWDGEMSGTMSFAVVLTDKSNGLVHSVIYDIPANDDGLPNDVEKAFAPADVPGAHQTRTLGGGGNNFGYAGPCPPVNDGAHVYEFALYALDVAVLPGASMATTQEQAETIILEHDLEVVRLTGMYDRN